MALKICRQTNLFNACPLETGVHRGGGPNKCVIFGIKKSMRDREVNVL